MRKSWMAFAIAGAGFAATGLAGDDVAIPEPIVQEVPFDAIRGAFPPVTERAVGLIFENVTGGNTSNTANPNWAIDDISLDPGSASTNPQTITGIAFAFAIRGTAGSTRDFDVLIEFFDHYNSAAPAGTPAWTGSMAPVIRVEFRGLNQNTAYTTPLIDISGLPSGGVPTTDRGFGIDIKFVEPGTNDLIVAPAVPVTHILCSNYQTLGVNTLTNGHGSFPYWRDAAGTVGVIEASDIRNFTWPTHARYWLRLRGDARCPADFNNDGQVDFFDYLDFVFAFSEDC